MTNLPASTSLESELRDEIDALKAQCGNDTKCMQGWECPKCGSVYSPFVMSCPTCAHSNYKIITTTTTGLWTTEKAATPGVTPVSREQIK